MIANVTVAVLEKDHTWREVVIRSIGANWDEAVANATFDCRYTPGNSEAIGFVAIHGERLPE